MTIVKDEWGEWEIIKQANSTVKNLINPSAKWLAKQKEIPATTIPDDPITVLRKELRDKGVMVKP